MDFFVLARFSSSNKLEKCRLSSNRDSTLLLIRMDQFVQVMATRPRSDIYINLPALEKLDAMLIVRIKIKSQSLLPPLIFLGLSQQ